MMRPGMGEEDEGLMAALEGVRGIRDGAMKARTMEPGERQKIMIEIGFAPVESESPEAEMAEAMAGEEEDESALPM